MSLPVLLVDAIRSRRTHKVFTGAPVARATLLELLDLARWAPTHRLSEPWRFAVLDQAAIARLIEFLRATPEIFAVPDAAKGAAKLEKLLSRLPSLGAMVQVTWMRSADELVDREDLAAAAAAVQNLLLGATALGLGSFWSSTAALAHPLTLQWCGIDTAREAFLGSIWLGTPADHPIAPRRRDLNERVRFL